LGVGPPSSLVQGAWAGRLVHFSGLDVLGPTAGAIARLLQDREVELWEGRRIVATLEDDKVRFHSTYIFLLPAFNNILLSRQAQISLQPTLLSA